MSIYKPVFLYTLFFIALLFASPLFALLLFKKPSHKREWELGQEKLAQVSFSGLQKNIIHIANIRNFNWKQYSSENWVEKKFNTESIVSVDVVVSHFSPRIKNIAHVFLIFNFSDGEDIGVSIEARRHSDKIFSILGGLKFDYELIYLFAHKRDLITLRKKREEQVFLYPTRTSAHKAQKLFKALAHKADMIYEKPRFYHILLRNCTGLIVNELKHISDRKFSFIESTLFPGKVGHMLFNMGLIKSNKSNFEEVQKECIM